MSAKPLDVAGLVLTSPNTVGLPIAERGDASASETRAVIAERWPDVERLLADGRAVEAISALETLAADMQRATESDAPIFRDALTLARRVLYDDLAEIGRVTGLEAQARDALARCADSDEELRRELEELAS